MFTSKSTTLAIEVFACVLVFAALHFLVMHLDDDAYHFHRSALAETTTPQNTLSMRGESVFQSVSEAIYFSLVTQSTVGYGSIIPVSPLAKTITATQIATTLLFVVRWATL
jgi:hypothetical protein